MTMNPFSTLPVEILQNIFSRAADRIKLHARPLPSGSQNPWYLALVCQDWKDVAFATPCLWSHISLQLITNIQTSYKRDVLLSAWNLCLVRSQSYPLTIELLSGSGYRDLGTQNQILRFIKPLMENAHRWETVAFRVPLDTLLPFLSNYQVQYSSLRRLYIENVDRSNSKQDPVGLFKDAPLLSCISLNHLPHHGQNLGELGAPWFQISHLKINVQSGNLGDVIRVLAYTPNLVTINYSITGHRFSGREHPPLELSHLEQIVWTSDVRMFGDTDPSAALFFNLLTAPQLSVLEVNGTWGDKDLEAIRGCLQRSKCSIIYLDLPACNLFSLLSLTPNVETVVLEDGPHPARKDHTTSFSDTLELAHLQKVIFRNNFNRDSDIFRLIVAPQLSVLEVIGQCGDILLEDIQCFLQRSQCSITSLELRTRRLSSLLNCTISVETFVLPAFDKGVLISLLNDLSLDHSASSWLFPKLKKVILRSNITNGPPFDAFIAMLKSRVWGPPNSFAKLPYSKLEELEVGRNIYNHSRHLIQERLAQEPLVITYQKQGHLHNDRDEWDFLISPASSPVTALGYIRRT